MHHVYEYIYSYIFYVGNFSKSRCHNSQKNVCHFNKLEILISAYINEES